jgi:CRP-like cAMP-binding protein
MPVEDGLLDGLARVSLFADLERSELDSLVGLLEQASFGEGEWIVRRGQADVGLYIIVEGDVGVVFEDEELAVFPRGGFFGEISALLGEPAVADIVARSPVRCAVVPAARVEEFLLSHPSVMLRMLQTEARRLRTADESRA